MTKKEREELKAEIVAEVLKEIQAKKLTSVNSEYSFKDYKQDVVKDDLAKVEAFINKRKRWTWFIPLVGIYIYAYAAQQMLNSMDRGAMRVAITRYQVRNTAWYVAIWLVCLPLLINIQPLVDWNVYKKAAAEVKANLDKNQHAI